MRRGVFLLQPIVVCAVSIACAVSVYAGPSPPDELRADTPPPENLHAGRSPPENLHTGLSPPSAPELEYLKRAFGASINGSLDSSVSADPALVLSRIILRHDYSDTFTEGAVGERFRALRFGATSDTLGLLPIERMYGNRQVLWSPDWVFATDTSVSPTAVSPYPGSSGRDSRTGLAEVVHEGATAFGLRYALRRDFIVQVQAVQPGEWIALSIGDNSARGALGDPTALVVRFYADGRITIGTAKAGEIDTGLDSDVRRAWEWHNYGVRFDLDAKRVEFYIDESFIGTVRLRELEGNPFAGTSYFSETVTVGATGGDRFWFDDFQIGAPFSEPTGPRFAMFPLRPDAFGGVSALSQESTALITGSPSEPPPNDPPVIPAPAALPAGILLLLLYALRERRRRVSGSIRCWWNRGCSD